MAVAAGLCQDISNDQIYSMGNMQMLCGILPLVSRDNIEGEDVRWNSGDHLALRALSPRSRRGSTVCPFHVLPSVECNDVGPCLGNKMLSFLLIIYFHMK